MPFDPLTSLIKLTTGNTPDELGTRAQEGNFAGLQGAGGFDSPTHAQASLQLSKRLGIPLAQAFGIGRELLGGATSKLGGGDFFGPSGFSVKDLASNQVGILSGFIPEDERAAFANQLAPFVQSAADFEKKQTGGPVGSNIRIPTATLMMQQGGQIQNDLLQQLVQRQQSAAALGGQAPPVQGQLPAGTGPSGGAGQVPPEQADSTGILGFLTALLAATPPANPANIPQGTPQGQLAPQGINMQQILDNAAQGQLEDPSSGQARQRGQGFQQGGEVAIGALQDLPATEEGIEFLRRRQKQLLEAAEKVAKTEGTTNFPKATGASKLRGVFGVDALLAPFFSALQNQPEGAELLRSFGISVPKQEFQTGGFVGNVIDQLGNVQANTGQLDAAAGQLQQFNPFGGGGLGGAAQNSLQSLLSTGNPVDVGGATQAAQNQANQTFTDLSGGINEQFGALGLGSSSARTAALGREASRAATEVGNTGLLAGIQSGENAANRQLGAQSPFLQGTGQQLQGQQAAGNLFGQSAGLDLQGQTAPLGASAGLAANLTNNLQQGIQNPSGGNGVFDQRGAVGSVRRGNSALGGGIGVQGGGGRAQSVGGPPQGNTVQVSRDGLRRFQTGGGIPTVQQGSGNREDRSNGNRVEFADHLGDMLFGQRFNLNQGGNRPIINIPSTVSQGQFGSPGSGAGAGSSPLRQAMDMAQFQAKLDNDSLGKQLDLQRQNEKQGLSDLVSFASGLGGASNSFAGGVQDLGADRNVGNAINFGLQDIQRLRGFQAGGGVPGVVEGPAVPPDQVPIMAQGGEGVITVQLMDRLRQAGDDPTALATIAKEIQQLMAESDGAPQEMQQGGQIFNRSQLFGGAGAELPQQPQIPTNQAANDPAGVAQFFQETGQTPTDLGQQGGAGGSFFGSGQESAPIDIRSQLEEANRRLQLFQGLELNSPAGSRIGSGEFTARAQNQVNELQKALVLEEQAKAQQALQERVATSIETAADTAANQPGTPAKQTDSPGRARAQELVDKNRQDGQLDEDALRRDLEREGLQGEIPSLFPDAFQSSEARLGQARDESINRVEVSRLEREMGMDFPSILAGIEANGGKISEGSDLEKIIQRLYFRIAEGDQGALELATLLNQTGQQNQGTI